MEILAEAKLGDADAGRSGQQEDAEIARDVLANPGREDLGARRVLIEFDLEAIQQVGDLFGVLALRDPAPLSC